VFEAMECLGGAGYVEESGLPRLYREAPVNSIWEGSGNVQCLDVLRALSREPETMEALFDELRGAAGASALFDAHVARLEHALGRVEDQERRARKLIEDVAVAIAASVLLRHGPGVTADAYVATRLGGNRGSEYGALDTEVDAAALLQRALPEA
jgi:putative acyl-CoA dehydrogenase